MLSNHLEALRRKANTTYKDVAAVCDLSEQTIYRACKGETADPGFSVVAGIVKACGGSLDEIAGLPRQDDGQRVTDLKQIIATQNQTLLKMEAGNRKMVRFVLLITAALITAMTILDVILFTCVMALL
jgi:DNA-binding XRE family transcriptional regulator